MSARPHSTTSSLSKKLTYTMGSRFQNGAYQHFFKARCAKCNKSEEVAWTAGSEPARIAKKMQELGWSYDSYRSRGCICPECKGKRAPEQASITEVKDTPIKRGRPRPLHVVEEIKARRAAPAIEDDPITIKKEEPAVAQVLTMSAAQPRTLTNAEKSGIRRLLDEHFDDAQGRYIDGYSDQRVGTELDVPWAQVANIREAAYGPLRSDPRIDRVQADLLDIKTKLASLQAKMMADIEKIGERMRTAEKIINDLNTGS